MGCGPMEKKKATDMTQVVIKQKKGEPINEDDIIENEKFFVYFDGAGLLHVYDLDTKSYRKYKTIKMSEEEVAHVKIGSRVFVVGGFKNGKAHSECLEIKFLSNSAIQKAFSPIPSPASKNALIASTQFLFSVGGINNSTELQDCWQYSIEKDCWSELPKIRDVKGAVSAAIYNKRFIYVFGSINSEKSVIDCLDLDHLSEGWVTQYTDSSGDLFNFSACFTYSPDSIFIFSSEGSIGWQYYVKKKYMETINLCFFPESKGFHHGMQKYKNAVYAIDEDKTIFSFDPTLSKDEMEPGSIHLIHSSEWMDNTTIPKEAETVNQSQHH